MKKKPLLKLARKFFLARVLFEGIRTRLIEKVGVRNTAGLVMFAVKNGLAD